MPRLMNGNNIQGGPAKVRPTYTLYNFCTFGYMNK